MAETPKKTRTTTTKAAAEKATTTAKPRKAATQKAANGATNGHVLEMERVVSQEAVAILAHTYWQQRGQQHGQHIEDWFRAEQELRSKAS